MGVNVTPGGRGSAAGSDGRGSALTPFHAGDPASAHGSAALLARLAERYAPQARRWATPGGLAATLDPSTKQTPALDLIDRELVNLIDGDDVDRLMLNCPPQEGKSTRVAHRFAEWALLDNPDLRIAIVSYSDDIARRWGSDIKLDTQTYDGTDGGLDLGIRLRHDSKAAGRWQIEDRKGGVYCVGVGGSLTGRPVDLLIIDDPIKDLEQAQSSAFRERVQRFWQSVAVPRLSPGAKAVVIQTRWHELDLSGWLLANEPDRWRVVSIPALAEKSDDPLGREFDEPMISARGDRDWDAIRASVGEYVWAALYQQRPAPAAGGILRRDKIRHWSLADAPSLARPAILCDGTEVYLETLHKFLTVDLAISKRTSADYTAIGVWGITLDGDLVLLDGARARLGEDEHWDTVKRLRSKWDAGTVHVEASQHGTTLVYEAGRNGVPIGKLEADTDKVTRALTAAARIDAGRVWYPQVDTNPWVIDWLDELAAFPNARHDDSVDVLSYAANVAATVWVPMQSAVLDQAYRPRRSQEDAELLMALGQDPWQRDVDFFGVQF